MTTPQKYYPLDAPLYPLYDWLGCSVRWTIRDFVHKYEQYQQKAKPNIPLPRQFERILLMSVRIHPTAEVSDKAQIGDNTSIWHHAQVREGASIGENCIIGKGVYIDAEVVIGNNVKIQNYVSVYHGVTLEDGVFVGPHVCFTNDLYPRAINPDGSLKAADDWVLSKTIIGKGAALGANSTIVCGNKIGAWAMIGSGSVVSRDIPDYGLAWGNPARVHGFVCPCGSKLETCSQNAESTRRACPKCHKEVIIPTELLEILK